MVTLLAKLAEQYAREHPTLGDGKVRALRRQLDSSRNQPWSLPLLQLHSQLAQVELEQGNAARAIELFEAELKGLAALGEAQSLPPALALEARYNLGVAHMRLGETANCCRRNSPSSCLLPIRADGIHHEPEHSRRAIAEFQRVFEQAPAESPLRLKSRWLLNLMHMTVGTWPDGVPEAIRLPKPLMTADHPFPPFPNRATAAGVDRFDLLGGAAAEDYDGDGDLDLITSTYDPAGSLAYFKNDGSGVFTEATTAARLEGILGGFNLTQADYDNDGDTDLLVLRGAWMGRAGRLPRSLLRNDGSGRFTDVTFDAGLGKVHYPTQTAGWADYDGDGDLDVFIGNEALDHQEHAPCQLFENRGDGTFVDVAERAGVLNGRFTKGVAWGDVNGDGWPDLYVSNLGADNRLYRNNGNGTFTDIARDAGVTGPKNSFPVWFWDFNNDGALDLYVSSYDWESGGLAAYVADRLGKDPGVERPRLYQGDGRGHFRDVAKAQQLDAISLPMGVNFGDLNNDGFLDFYLGTGYPDYEALMPNVMYLNQSGRGFADVTLAGGFGHLQKGHGVVFADFDRDGDQDVFAQMGGFLPGDKFYNALFDNPGFDNHWIILQLEGRQANRSGLGARLTLTFTENGQRRMIHRQVGTGGSFGANPLSPSIGLGKAAKIDQLEIRWPKPGGTQTFKDLPVNQTIRLTEGQASFKTVDR